MKYLIIISFLFLGCSDYNEKFIVVPTIEGEFINDNITLIFDNGILSGDTECNSLRGDYFISYNEIFINIGATKIFCENEFNIKYIRDTYSFKITGDTLVLIGSDYDLILTKIY